MTDNGSSGSSEDSLAGNEGMDSGAESDDGKDADKNKKSMKKKQKS